MIVRARPKFLATGQNTGEWSPDPQRLYFDHGRSALSFLLTLLRQRTGRQLVVGLQSFNCGTVADAIIHSGNRGMVLDVDPECFSVTPAIVSKSLAELDVLLLTHYQGLINPAYAEIAEQCGKQGVWLIDDAAQTEGSRVNGQLIGSLADFKLESYAFDKPFSSLTGGALLINSRVPPDLQADLVRGHAAQPEEFPRKAQLDLKALDLLMDWTTPEHYRGRFPYNLVRRLLGAGVPTQAIRGWLVHDPATLPAKVGRFINHQLTRLSPAFPAVKRLHSLKVKILEQQRATAHRPGIKLWQPQLNRLGLSIPIFPGVDVHWNRLSVLDSEAGTLRGWCAAHGIEAANYNWPEPLHVLFADHPRFTMNGAYAASSLCARRVVNLPIWMEELP